MAKIDSIENMVGEWHGLVERPAINDAGSQTDSPVYREQIVDGFNALRAAIITELGPEEGEAYEVDVTEGSLHWLEEGDKIPTEDVAVAGLFRISRYIGPEKWLDEVESTMPTAGPIDDPLTFDLTFLHVAEETDYVGDAAVLRLPSLLYPEYQGKSVLLTAERLYGKPSTEVLGQLVCLGSNEVSAYRPAEKAEDPLSAEPPQLPPWNGNTLVPAGVKLDQPYNVPTGAQDKHHHEVYVGGAVLYPFSPTIPRQ